MKTFWSLSLLLCILWGAAPAQASCRSSLGDTPPGVILPAWDDPQASLTLDVLVESLPPDCVQYCTFRLCLVFVMTDGQEIEVELQTQRYPRVVGGRAILRVTHRVDPSDPEGDYTKYKDGHLAPGTPLRIRASARRDTTHLALTWGDRRVVHRFAVPWRSLASVQVQLYGRSPGFSAQIQFPEPPPVIKRWHLPTGGYDFVFTDALLTIREVEAPGLQ